MCGFSMWVCSTQCPCNHSSQVRLSWLGSATCPQYSRKKRSCSEIQREEEIFSVILLGRRINNEPRTLSPVPSLNKRARGLHRESQARCGPAQHGLLSAPVGTSCTVVRTVLNLFLGQVPCLTFPGKRFLGKSQFLGHHYLSRLTAKGRGTTVFSLASFLPGWLPCHCLSESSHLRRGDRSGCDCSG